MAKKTEIRKGAVVEVRMINPKKTGTVTLRDYTDPDTQALRKFKDSNGNPRVKKYTKALTVLRLDIENDALEYEHIKHHPLYVQGAHPILRIVDITLEAEDRTSKRESALEALIEAKGLRGDKLYNFARVLGVNTLNVLESIVKDKVYDIAEKTPTEFLKAFNDPNRVFKEVLHKGKTKGVFAVKNNIWKFRETLMGANIDEAILWLNDNEDLMPSIRKELSSVSV
tara:strand:+ start:4087 stop:4764 length:678 start_codon:yes stop_codon:yes gene_type:complete